MSCQTSMPAWTPHLTVGELCGTAALSNEDLEVRLPSWCSFGLTMAPRQASDWACGAHRAEEKEASGQDQAGE
jgi:hypothetical protein